MKNIIWAVVALVLIALIFFLILQKRQSNQVIPMPNSYEDCVEAGGMIMESFPEQCAIGGQVFVREVKEINDNEEASDAKDVMGKQDIFDGVDSFSLKDVTDGNATGEAWIVVKNGKTFHKAEGMNLPVLENNDFYEGWLVKKTPALDFFSTGEMIQNQETGKWILNYETEGDKSDYPEVVITLEPDDGDPAPAAHILEGIKKIITENE